MTVKKPCEWQTMENVKTLVQMRSHIENCKDWLTTTSEEEEELHVTRSKAAIDLIVGERAAARGGTVSNIGIRREDVPAVGHFFCFLCQAEKDIAESSIITANPFTRAQCMLLCQDCAS